MEDMIARLEKEATAYEKKAHEQRELAAMNDLMARHARKALEELLKARESVLKYAHDNGQVSANGQPTHSTKALLNRDTWTPNAKSMVIVREAVNRMTGTFTTNDVMAACEITLSRETLSRALRELVKENVITLLRQGGKGVASIFQRTEELTNGE